MNADNAVIAGQSDETGNQLGRVNEQCADVTDWSRNALMIGVKVAGEERPWLEMSYEDLKLLHALLTKPLRLVTDAGIVVSPPITEESDALRKLAVWLGGAAAWMEKRK